MSKRYSVDRVVRMKKKRDMAGLIDALEQDDGEVARAAAISLGQLGDERGADWLLRNLRAIDLSSATTEEEYEWGYLASALGKVAEPGSPAADELLAALERPDGVPSRSAAEGLAEMGERRAIEPLVRRLDRIDYRFPKLHWDDFQYVSEALGTLKATEAIEPLIVALEAEDYREMAAAALGEIGDPRAVPALAALLEPEPPLWVGNATVVALDAIGTAEARQAVAAWEERGVAPADAHEWIAAPIPLSRFTRLRWWFRSRFL